MAGPARVVRQGAGELTTSPLRTRRRHAAVSRVDARELTQLGAVMLAAAVVVPALPSHPGISCPLRAVTGVPCPLCGMTTSVEATMHLRLGDAVAANPAGVVAVVVAVVLLIWRPATVPVSLPVVWAALGVMWVFELHRFGLIL